MGYVLKPADLLLIKGDGLIPDAIEYITHSTYSHVAGVAAPGLLIEAQGMRRTGYEWMKAYKGCADVFTCDDLTDEQRQRMILRMHKFIGRRYSYLLIGWELLRYTLGITLMPGKSWDPIICSTLWAVEGYRYVGIDLCPGIQFPSPADIAESKLLRKVGSF